LQVLVKTQRLEELAIKQSRQLIPVTPSMPKALVSKLPFEIFFYWFELRKLVCFSFYQGIGFPEVVLHLRSINFFFLLWGVI